jgi:hypothetical protein
MTSLGFRPVDRPRTHGLWLDRRSWEGWKRRFVRRGHQVLAPRAWPRRMGFDQIVHMFRESPRIGEERND